MLSILTDRGIVRPSLAEFKGDDLWLTPPDLVEATGFELKPEGFCRAEFCIPIPPGRASEFSAGGMVNVTGFWREQGGIVLHDESAAAWILGTSAAARAARLASLEAPDFTLPDANGRMHSLSDYRGLKVLLAAWASW